MYKTPLELYKLCCNIVVKEIYSNNYYIFVNRLYTLNLPKDINELIIDRYKVIKHIIEVDKFIK